MKGRLILVALAGAALFAPATARASCQDINNPLGGSPIASACADTYENGEYSGENVYVVSGYRNAGVALARQDSPDVSILSASLWAYDTESQDYVSSSFSTGANNAQGQDWLYNDTYAISYTAGRYCQLHGSASHEDLVHGNSGWYWDCWEL